MTTAARQPFSMLDDLRQLRPAWTSAFRSTTRRGSAISSDSVAPNTVRSMALDQQSRECNCWRRSRPGLRDSRQLLIDVADEEKANREIIPGCALVEAAAAA
jgi:hypothetical protein